MENLRQSEDMPTLRAIGFVEPVSGRQGEAAAERHPEAIATIAAWAASKGYDAAIWSALAGNFGDWGKGGEPFSVSAALQYLEALERDDPPRIRGGARLYPQHAGRDRDAGARARRQALALGDP